MQRVGDQQMHVAVKPAEEGEIGGERRDVAVVGVADFDGDQIIGAGFQGVGRIEDKRGKSAAMFAEASRLGRTVVNAAP